MESKIESKTVQRLDIFFVTKSRITKLNLLYRNKNYATDVLSFARMDSKYANYSDSLGDLIISLDVAKSQAVDFGNDFPQEILRLCIHGILHLLGYDHENVSKKREREMQSLEDQLFIKYSGKITSILV